MKITNILLAFQLENYMNWRFLKFIYTHPRFWIYGSSRQVLVWTKKAQLIFIITHIFILIDIIGLIYIFGISYVSCIGILFVGILLPLYYVISNIFISPLDIYLKNRIIKKAKQKRELLKNLNVIGITGSYGKTSTKEILKTILSQKLKVIAPEGTKNTMLGTSELILTQLDDTIEVLIVEMGAYKKGDIKELCDFVKPNIAVLTGITLQHLERFGSLQNIQDAKFEIFEGLGENDLAIIDISSSGALEGYTNKKKFLSTKNIYTLESPSSFRYLADFKGIEFEIDGVVYTTKLIAKHIVNTIKIAIKIATYLGLSKNEISRGISQIEYVKHRMEVIKNPVNNTIIIDDSFNGNLEGIHSMIESLKNTPFNGRKILILGGIVELGDKLIEINKQIGSEFSQVADMILLTRGPVGEAIEKGLIESGYKKESIRMYEHSLDLHKDLGNIIQSGDLIVFQNDLTDNYL